MTNTERHTLILHGQLVNTAAANQYKAMRDMAALPAGWDLIATADGWAAWDFPLGIVGRSTISEGPEVALERLTATKNSKTNEVTA